MVTSIEPTGSNPLTKFGAGPAILGLGVGLFVLTRIINWLPLGLIDGFLNAILWPAIVVCVGVGGFMTWRKFSKEP